MQARIVEGGAVDPTRKLYRSKSNRKLAGVCGGLAQYFNLDATLIRVLFIALAVLGGSGLVLYLGPTCRGRHRCNATRRPGASEGGRRVDQPHPVRPGGLSG